MALLERKRQQPRGKNEEAKTIVSFRVARAAGAALATLASGASGGVEDSNQLGRMNQTTQKRHADDNNNVKHDPGDDNNVKRDPGKVSNKCPKKVPK